MSRNYIGFNGNCCVYWYAMYSIGGVLSLLKKNIETQKKLNIPTFYYNNYKIPFCNVLRAYLTSHQ